MWRNPRSVCRPSTFSHVFLFRWNQQAADFIFLFRWNQQAADFIFLFRWNQQNFTSFFWVPDSQTLKILEIVWIPLYKTKTFDIAVIVAIFVFMATVRIKALIVNLVNRSTRLSWHSFDGRTNLSSGVVVFVVGFVWRSWSCRCVLAMGKPRTTIPVWRIRVWMR